MLELLISILLMLGMQFEKLDGGQVKIDGNATHAYELVRSDVKFEELGGEPALQATNSTDGSEGNE